MGRCGRTLHQRDGEAMDRERGLEHWRGGGFLEPFGDFVQLLGGAFLLVVLSTVSEIMTKEQVSPDVPSTHPRMPCWPPRTSSRVDATGQHRRQRPAGTGSRRRPVCQICTTCYLLPCSTSGSRCPCFLLLSVCFVVEWTVESFVSVSRLAFQYWVPVPESNGRWRLSPSMDEVASKQQQNNARQSRAWMRYNAGVYAYL